MLENKPNLCLNAARMWGD